MTWARSLGPRLDVGFTMPGSSVGVGVGILAGCPLWEVLQPRGGCAKACPHEWEVACLCHYEREAVDKHLCHWEIVRGCEKEIVRFGVTIVERLGVNRRLFSSLSPSCVCQGEGGCRGCEREAVCLTVFGEVERCCVWSPRRWNSDSVTVRNKLPLPHAGRTACPGLGGYSRPPLPRGSPAEAPPSLLPQVTQTRGV